MKHKSAEEIKYKGVWNPQYLASVIRNPTMDFQQVEKTLESWAIDILEVNQPSQEIKELPTKEEMRGITARYLHGVKFDSERERKNAFTDYIKGLEEGIQLASTIIAKKDEEIRERQGKIGELSFEHSVALGTIETLQSDLTKERFEKEELRKELSNTNLAWEVDISFMESLKKKVIKLESELSTLRNENEQLKQSK